jgi:hypothetical protein
LPADDVGAVIPSVLKVCSPVNVCTASVLAIVADVVGNVIVVESVPVKVKDLLTVNVLPSATANVLEVAGAVIAILLMLVAVATPSVGVTSVGEVLNTELVEVVPVAPVAVYPVMLLKAVILAEVALVPPLATGSAVPL